MRQNDEPICQPALLCSLSIGRRVRVIHPKHANEWTGEYIVVGLVLDYQRSGGVNVCAVLRESGPLNFWDIKRATGMAEGSLSANLSTLVGLEVIQKNSTRQPGEVGRARRENTIYSLAAIACDGAEQEQI